MAMQLDRVVPFGRTFDEYRRMFALTSADLVGRILGCGDGPASFNAELTALGGRVVSVDPLYQYPVTEVRRRFDETVDGIFRQVHETPQDWVWKVHRSPDELRERRIEAIEAFASDFDAGLSKGRYRVGELPALEFAEGEFDLALCSHLLFLYSDQFSEEFHVASVAELCRVAAEVRVFPLLSLSGRPSPHLEPVVAWAESCGLRCDIEPVDYELQKGGNRQLRITRERDQ